MPKLPIACIWGIGPAIMMKFVALTSQPYGVKTLVSLNSIMVDGTGMCRCLSRVGGGQNAFRLRGWARVRCPSGGLETCLLTRQRIYLDQEKQALEAYERELQS